MSIPGPGPVHRIGTPRRPAGLGRPLPQRGPDPRPPCRRPGRTPCRDGGDSVKTVSVRGLQKRPRQCVDDAQADCVVVTRHGRPAAVLVGVEGSDWETVVRAYRGEPERYRQLSPDRAPPARRRPPGGLPPQSTETEREPNGEGKRAGLQLPGPDRADVPGGLLAALATRQPPVHRGIPFRIPVPAGARGGLGTVRRAGRRRVARGSGAQAPSLPGSHPSPREVRRRRCPAAR